MVFIRAEDLVYRKPVADRVLVDRRDRGKILDTLDRRKPVQPAARGEPPCSRVILQDELKPTPTEEQRWRKESGMDRVETLAIEDGEDQAAAKDAQLPRAVFENRGDGHFRQPFSLAECRESAPGQTHGSAIARAYPEVAVPIMRQRTHARVAQAVGRRVLPAQRPLAAHPGDQFADAFAGRDLDSPAWRLDQR